MVTVNLTRNKINYIERREYDKIVDGITKKIPYYSMITNASLPVKKPDNENTIWLKISVFLNVFNQDLVEYIDKNYIKEEDKETVISAINLSIDNSQGKKFDKKNDSGDTMKYQNGDPMTDDFISSFSCIIDKRNNFVICNQVSKIAKKSEVVDEFVDNEIPF